MIKLTYYITILFLLCFYNNLKAQDYKRTAYWYFGDKAGLHYTDLGVVLADTLSQINVLEGCATISDTNGNLLFYTNGVTVWNKNHQIMGNLGIDNLMLSTQRTLIVPQPENDSLFYIFNTTNVGFRSDTYLRYAIININENNGLGKIIKGNAAILPQYIVNGKLTASHHQNGTDIWIVTHKDESNSFYSYIVNKNGLITNPVISNIGGVDNTTGDLKISTDGRIVASSNPLGIELFEFDNLTGKIEKQIGYLDDIGSTYGIEFSANSQFLYCTNDENSIFQFDISSKNDSIINNSKKIIYSTQNNYLPRRKNIQLASDNKIYVSILDSNYIGVINFPDSSDTLSDYINNQQLIPNRKCKSGLPNFITSYFYRPKIDFTYYQNCNNSIIEFKEKYDAPFNIITWNIYKDSTFIQRYNVSNPTHTFLFSGLYDIELIINADTVKKQVFVDPPILNFHDTFFCNTDSFIVKIPNNYRSIDWNVGKDTNQYTINQSGKYTVSAFNSQGCYVSDTLIIKFSKVSKPNIYQTNDSLYTDSIYNDITWYRNNISLHLHKPFLKITDTGIYYLLIENELGCKNTSEIIEINCNINQPNIRKLNDTILTDSLALKYTWYKNNEQLSIDNYQLIINDTGNYYVKITNQYGCEDSSDVLEISCINQKPNLKISNDSLYTDSTALKYTWYLNNIEIPNSNSKGIKIKENGIYKLITEQKFGCVNSKDTVISYLSIFDLYEKNIKVYPNPFNNQLKIASNDNKTMEISIYDVSGKLIYNQTISENLKTINTENLASGIYILKINNSFHYKIMKQ